MNLRQDAAETVDGSMDDLVLREQIIAYMIGPDGAAVPRGYDQKQREAYEYAVYEIAESLPHIRNPED